MLQSMFGAAVLFCASLAAAPLAAESLDRLWSFGLTSIRSGAPLIEEGGQHRIDPGVYRDGYTVVQDRHGNLRAPTARPLEGGEQIVLTDTYQDDPNTRAYALIVALMAPIRDMILYDFESSTRTDWDAVTAVLTLNGIKTVDAPDPSVRRAELSTSQIWDYVAAAPTDGNPVLQYLEEAELELKCLSFTGFDFTNPEGANHCVDHGLVQGTGLRLP